MEPYRYTPLSAPRNIRLLDLFPGEPGSPLKCKLLEVSLNDCHYEAISYCWGDPTFVLHVECDDRLIPVTKSCAEVLDRFRPKRKHRILWIDAICIDQSSDSEIEQQIPLMGDLYRQAARTLIWLGPGTRVTDVICKRMRSIGRINSKGNYPYDDIPFFKRFRIKFHKQRLLREKG